MDRRTEEKDKVEDLSVEEQHPGAGEQAPLLEGETRKRPRSI